MTTQMLLNCLYFLTIRVKSLSNKLSVDKGNSRPQYATLVLFQLRVNFFSLFSMQQTIVEDDSLVKSINAKFLKWRSSTWNLAGIPVSFKIFFIRTAIPWVTPRLTTFHAFQKVPKNDNLAVCRKSLFWYSASLIHDESSSIKPSSPRNPNNFISWKS